MGETGDITTGFTQPSSPHPEPKPARTRSHAKLPRIHYQEKESSIPFGPKGLELYQGMKETFQNLDTASSSVKVGKNLKFDTLKKRQRESGEIPKQIVIDLGVNPETNKKTKIFFTDPKGHLEKNLGEIEQNPTYSKEEKQTKQKHFISTLLQEIEQGHVAIQTKMKQETGETETEITATKENLDDMILRADKKITKKECTDDDMKALAAVAGEILGIEVPLQVEVAPSEQPEVQEELQKQETDPIKEYEKKLLIKPSVLPQDETEGKTVQQEKKDIAKERIAEKQTAARQHAETQREEEEKKRSEHKRDERALEKKQGVLEVDITKTERRKKEELMQPTTAVAQEKERKKKKKW